MFLGCLRHPTAADNSEPTVSTPASPPSSIEATATVGPGRGTGFFAGSAPEVPVTFTMPAGWEADGAFVSKSGADPVFGLGATPARDVTVDGFEGKQIQITIPGYNENECKEGKFGILQGDHSSGNAPWLWAQAPKQQNKMQILDVDGTRLVILATSPPNISAHDRTELDGILSTIQIG